MPYAYNAAMWCAECAEAVMADLDAKGVTDTGDTDDYPQADSSVRCWRTARAGTGTVPAAHAAAAFASAGSD